MKFELVAEFWIQENYTSGGHCQPSGSLFRHDLICRRAENEIKMNTKRNWFLGLEVKVDKRSLLPDLICLWWQEEF